MNLSKLWRGVLENPGQRRSRHHQAPSCASIERVEPRCYLSISSVFNASTGALTITSDGRDAIMIGSDADGQVTLNGAVLKVGASRTSAGSPVAASAVMSLNVMGGSGNNTINLSGVTSAAFTALTSVNINGGNGNDRITGSPFADNIEGGNGNDALSGLSGNDSLSGGNGNDTLDGGDGNDQANGGNGNDTAIGGAGDDLLNGGSANDQLSGDDGQDTLEGGQGNDNLQGGEGNDSLGGGANNDTLSGGSGDDQLNGGANNDRADGGAGNDRIDGNYGNDTLTGGDGNDSVTGGSGNDSIGGGTGNDHLQADAGADRVNGDDGNDSIFGGAGDDSLNGGAGNDAVVGGGGADQIVIDAGDGVNADGANHDAGAPVAANDSATVAEGGSVDINVLANDADELPAAGLHVSAMSSPAYGTLTLNADGTFSYQHDGSENLSDSFTYKVNDGVHDSDVVTVSITITPVNDKAPVAGEDSGSTVEGGSVTVSVLANDSDGDLPGDTLSVIKVSDPMHGSVTINPDGTITYQHDGSETTSDSFTYKVNDGANDSNVVTVAISITPVNDNAPVAGDDNATLDTGASASISVLSNDSDSDLPADSLTVFKVSDPVNGTATVNPDGTVTYVHNGGDSLSDSFTYKLNDGVQDGNVATVTITITPPVVPT